MALPPSLRLGDFSFQPPAGWSSQVIATGPPEGGFRPNFVALAAPSLPGETAEQFAARTAAEARQNTVGYQILQEGSATFGDASGWLRQHVFLQGSTRIGQLQLYVVSDGWARTFTFTHLADRLEAAREVAVSLFSSIRVLSAALERLKFEGQVRG
ncbi:MAG TPA: DcrB-related protein [Myxococcales bacterium]|nr:DcrB-related protein [Myxococcales bacterium]